MAINWGAFETQLLDSTTRELTSFGAGNALESFYGFMFDCNSDYGQVLLCLNTEESLQKQAESYKRDHADLYANKTINDIKQSLRWNAGDWAHQGFNSGSFDSDLSEFESSVADATMDEEEDEETFMPPTQDRFMKSVCRVLLRLERTNAFDCLVRTADFRTFVADHDETDDDSWGRLKMVRESAAQ